MDARLALEPLGGELLDLAAEARNDYLLVASAALGGILLFLLAAASANSSIFASHIRCLILNG
jgi:hypothetical protein